MTLSVKDLSEWIATASRNERDSLIIHRCSHDLEMFSYLFFPHYCKLPFSDMHRDQFRAYDFGERSVRRVDAAPREFAKTTLKALFRVIHDCCYHTENYIIISSNTEEQSIQKAADVRTELLENDFLISVYGSFFTHLNVAKGKFVVSNGGHQTLIHAAGSKKELRGGRFGAFRPTKIIIDDFEHSLEVESEVVRDKTKGIFYDVFTKLGDKSTNIEVIGTVLHRRALLADLLKNPGYESNTYTAIISWSSNQGLWEQWKAIYTDMDNPNHMGDAKAFYESNKTAMLEGTRVLWPEKYSYYHLMEEIIIYGMRSFMKERQNSPGSSDDKIFDKERMKFYIDLGEEIELCHNKMKIRKRDMKTFGVIDPSTGQEKPKVGKKGDFTCLLTGLLDDNGRIFVHHDYTKRTAPSNYIKKILDFHEHYNYKAFGVEANLYRNLLIPNIRDEKKRRNENRRNPLPKLPITEIIQKENKQKRIYTVEPRCEHGWIFFNKALSLEFYNQLWDFPSPDAHDDAPDALEMLWAMTHKYAPIRGLKLGRSL